MEQKQTFRPMPRAKIDELLASLDHKAGAETWEGELCNRARQLIREFLERDESAWLIESAIQDSKGPYYLCVYERPGYGFEWKPDHMRAIRFGRKVDAERVRDAVRALQPDLFPSIVPHPQAVDHAWVNIPREVIEAA
jgi:hypothetical protein